MRAGLYQTKKGLAGLLGIIAVQEVDDLAGNLFINGLRSVVAKLLLFSIPNYCAGCAHIRHN
jgi:hypothetical protein